VAVSERTHPASKGGLRHTSSAARDGGRNTLDSAHEFWDGEDLFGVQYRQVLGWRGNAWDVYMVYGPKAQWNGDLSPVPDFFMHQTSENRPLLDASPFGTKLKQLL